MASKLEIVNMALDELGEAIIADVDGTEDRTLIAARHWDRALRAFLREAPWSWALKQDELAEASPVPAFGWEARYPLPDDFVALYSLNELNVYYFSDVHEIQSGYLMTDADEAKIKYVYFPTATELDAFLERMDGQALDIFVLLLAARMAPKMVRDGRETALTLEQQYRQAISRVRTAMANERRAFIRDPAGQSNFELSRYGDIQG